jgi:peptidoglycan/LPS O-acetylase OafA/YrhL
LLANRVARYLGKISYGLYVFHLVAIEMAEKIAHRLWSGGPPWVGVAALALAITIAVAAASYQLLERPFLRLKRRFEAVATRPI